MNTPRVIKKEDPALWPALEALRDSKPVLVTPTDTLYGFSTRWDNAEGIQRVRSLKGLNRTTFIVLIRNAEDLALLSRATTEQARIALRYWPGPITFILPGKTDGETIALRMPRDPFLDRLLDALGGPLISTSCNIHGLPPAGDIHAATRQFGTAVDLYVDGGTIPHLIPSTLVDLTGPSPKILRPGALSFP